MGERSEPAALAATSPRVEAAEPEREGPGSGGVIEVRGQDSSKPLSQARKLDIDGDASHAASGFAFPASVEAKRTWKRVGVVQYDAGALDMSFGYDTGNPLIETWSATIYVYPAPRHTFIGSDAATVARYEPDTLTRAMDGLASSLRGAHPGATFTEVLRTRVEAGAARFDARQLKYVQGWIESLAMLWITPEGWLVKVRYTYPAPSRTRALPALDELLRALPWGEGAPAPAL